MKNNLINQILEFYRKHKDVKLSENGFVLQVRSLLGDNPTKECIFKACNNIYYKFSSK